MRLILFLLFPLASACQEAIDPLDSYRHIEKDQLLTVKGSVVHIQAIEYTNISARKYDSIVNTRYASGNIQTQTGYSRNTKGINFITEYLDNNKIQPDKVYGFDAYGKKTLKNSYSYNKYGLEEVMSYEYGSINRRWLYTYNEEGQLTEYKGMAGNSTDWDYKYSYDDYGRLQQETHIGSGDDIYYSYDYKGNKVQEIYHSENGKKIEKLLTYIYDDAGHLTALQVALGGGNMVKDFYKYDQHGLKTERLNIDAAGYIDTKQTFTYDDAGNLKDEQTLRPGYLADAWFDSSGSVTKRIERNISANKYIYDQQKRLTRIDFLPGAPGITPNSILYEYDSAGNLKTITDSQIKKDFTYNKDCNHVATALSFTKQDFLFERSFYTYNKNCLLQQKIICRFYEYLDYGPYHQPDTLTSTYRYDADNKLVSEITSTKGTLVSSLTLTYNRKNVSAATVVDEKSQETKNYLFNDKGVLLQMKISGTGQQPEINNFTYTFDEKGNWIKRFNKKEINGKAKDEVAERNITY